MHVLDQQELQSDLHSLISLLQKKGRTSISDREVASDWLLLLLKDS